MQNIEFKAELRDHDVARAQCLALGATPEGVREQIDTYYRMPDGRLKRRESPGRMPMYIAYHRDNRPTTKVSEYSIYTEEQANTRWGMLSLRPWVTVVKTREAYLLDNVRIHLDQIQDLGVFIEFEAIVSRKNPRKRCTEQVNELREIFADVLGEPIGDSYSDLIARRSEPEISE